MRGDKGNPREWLYSWYSPRQSAGITVRDFAFTRDGKLYRDSRFSDLAAKMPEKIAVLRARMDEFARADRDTVAKD